jgi:TnpA family transposase
MATASQGVTRDQLLWTHDAYIRDDSYRAALAVLINAHHRLPFSRVWGDGATSSSAWFPTDRSASTTTLVSARPNGAFDTAPI